MVETTRVFKQTKTSKSLRTTIPKSVVTFLDLENGDDLIWEIDMADGKRKVQILNK